jgi:predicted amidohydrolase YtcJ
MGQALIIENARIYTMDHELPYASAIAIRDGRIVAVGSKEDMALLPGGVRRIDAGGRAIIPGLIDAHIHFLGYSRSLAKIELDGVRTKEEILAMVAAKAREVGPGRWVLGGGWNNNLWGSAEYPTKHDLDAVAPDNPVLLDRKDLHSVWVNSLALQKAKVTRDTPDPPGAAIGKGADGEPDGMLYEGATRLIHGAVDEAPEDAITAMKRGFGMLTSMGLVGFHDCEGPDAFAAFQTLDAMGELPMRVVILLAYYTLEETIRVGLRTGFGSDRLRTGPVKIFSDGSLGSSTAQMLEPFEGQPNNYGIGTIPQEEMEEAVLLAAQSGIPAAIHAIGDAANRRVLDAFEKTREAMGVGYTGRNRIEHAQLLHPDDIPRFAALGVVASMQPIHATSDMHAADRLWGARSRYSYAWRSVLNAGGMLAFGSDAPVETPNPFVGIHAAVTRQDAQDQPVGGWYPEERLTVEEAVRAYAEGAARSCPYLPGVTGMLTPGSVADLLILDRDIFMVSPHEIKDTKPLVTMVDGEAVYDPEGMIGK